MPLSALIFEPPFEFVLLFLSTSSKAVALSKWQVLSHFLLVVVIFPSCLFIKLFDLFLFSRHLLFTATTARSPLPLL